MGYHLIFQSDVLISRMNFLDIDCMNLVSTLYVFSSVPQNGCYLRKSLDIECKDMVSHQYMFSSVQLVKMSLSIECMTFFFLLYVFPCAFFQSDVLTLITHLLQGKGFSPMCILI